jgi:hypothetical protein
VYLSFHLHYDRISDKIKLDFTAPTRGELRYGSRYQNLNAIKILLLAVVVVVVSFGVVCGVGFSEDRRTHPMAFETFGKIVLFTFKKREKRDRDR